jgi:hypothetical protein
MMPASYCCLHLRLGRNESRLGGRLPLPPKKEPSVNYCTLLSASQTFATASVGVDPVASTRLGKVTAAYQV